MPWRVHQSGRYEWRETVKFPSGQRKRVSGWGSTPEEAERDLRSKIYELLTAEPKVWTFQRFANERYAPTIINLSVKWRGQVAWALDGHLFPAFGSRVLAECSRHELQLFFNRRLSTMSRSSVGHLRKVAYGVFALAEADSIIPSNPVRHVKLPPVKRVEYDTYSLAEIGMLLEDVDGPIRDFIILTALMGLRGSEAANARWNRVDTVLRVETAKTEAGVRELPKCPLLSDRGRLPKGWKWSNKWHDELERVSALTGLRFISAHGLRRSFAANLRKMGVDAEMRKDLMGHAGDVQRRYAGSWIEGARAVLEKMWAQVVAE